MMWPKSKPWVCIVFATLIVGCSLTYRWRNDLGVVVFDSSRSGYKAPSPHREHFEADREECTGEARVATPLCDTDDYTPFVARICQQRSQIYRKCMEDRGYVREGCRDCRW